jgi:hypothetical protein
LVSVLLTVDTWINGCDIGSEYSSKAPPSTTL